ncbi:MAG: DUF2934 domain-containing protein [Verrucomicrobiota bacterium]
MKDNNFPQDQKPAATSLPKAAINLNQNETNFSPPPDEVARKAYSSYVNQGSRPGHEVRHWLAAEAELIAERKRAQPSRFSSSAIK